MKAMLEKIDLNSMASFEKFLPKDLDCFGFWITISVGSYDTVGADDFQIFVCNREWIERENVTGKYLRVESPYCARTVIESLQQFLDSCDGTSWIEVVEKVSKVGSWEYEGYKS